MATKSEIKSFKLDLKVKTITLVLSLEPYESASGKSNMLASSGGFKQINEKYKGKNIDVSFNIKTPV